MWRRWKGRCLEGRSGGFRCLVFRGDRAAYELTFGKGQVTATRARIVHGITISSTTLPATDWLAELGAEVRDIATQTEDANDALLDLL